MSLSEADVGFILDTRDFFSNAAIWPQHPGGGSITRAGSTASRDLMTGPSPPIS